MPIQVFVVCLSMSLAAKPFTLDRQYFAIMLFFETLEHRSPDPATAVIRSQFAIGNDEHTCLGLLHHYLAGRDENSEVDDPRWRPLICSERRSRRAEPRHSRLVLLRNRREAQPARSRSLP